MTVRLANAPDYRVSLNGKDLTPAFRPRLVSLTITETREDADQLDIVVDDSDGRVALPKAGDRLTVDIGWKAGTEVRVGLVSKGVFLIDDVTHSGPPDEITIRGRSADFTEASELRTRREQSWTRTTLGAIVRELAARQNLEPRISDDLAAVQLDAVHQSRESDAALVRRLGREHDAVATIKGGRLLFMRVGAGQTASGQDLPGLTYNRRDGDRHTYQMTKREAVTGVTASYHDFGQAKKVKVVVGEEKGAKHLSRVYASKSSAKRAAEAAQTRAARDPATLELIFSLGQADIYPERHLTVSGFKPEIDGTKWLVAEVEHTITEGGFTSQLKLQPAP